MAAPVTRDQELELTIDRLAYGGNGVARLNGFVVFVRRGLPGDTVRARVTKVQRRHAEALVTEVLQPSPLRVEAPCNHFPACGGCRFQDLAYEAQAQSKHDQVADALRRIGGFAEPPLEELLPADEIFHYRNKLEYSFTQLEDGPTLGFHKAGRWDEVLQIDECWLTTDVGNAVRNAVREWVRGDRLVAYDQTEHTGYLRHLVVREGRNTGQMLVQLVTAPGEKFDRGGFVDVLRQFPQVRSIHWAVNDGPAEVTTNLPSELLWGEEAIEEELCGLRFRVRPNAFLQTNTAMAEKLYAPWQGRQVPDSYKFAVSAIQQERTGKTFTDHMQSGAFAMGNPDSVIKVLKKYQEAGVDQILCFMQMGNLAHARIMKSIALFGRHVIPAFA